MYCSIGTLCLVGRSALVGVQLPLPASALFSWLLSFNGLTRLIGDFPVPDCAPDRFVGSVLCLLVGVKHIFAEFRAAIEAAMWIASAIRTPEPIPIFLWMLVTHASGSFEGTVSQSQLG